MKKIDFQTSQIASLIKLASIYLVVTGHFYQKFPWIASWIAIFNFSFLSGYFTYVKYEKELNLKEYWIRKFKRLGINLFVINTFLLIYFSIKGKAGILTWQTLLSIMGLNGFLYWFYIPNPSPFRVEIWFLTLLIIFYSAFPLLRKIYKSKVVAYTFSLAVLSITGYLVKIVQYNFPFWIAITAFCVSGVYCMLEKYVAWKNSAIVFILLLVACLILNKYEIKILNFYFIFFCSLAFLQCVIKFPWPKTIIRKKIGLANCTLEVYLIHRYLFVYYTGYSYIDFIISLVIISITALILKKISMYFIPQIWWWKKQIVES